MTEAKLVGGSESDRRQILEKHHKYLEANGVFDWETLRDQLWSSMQDNLFFNLNGHTYVGRDHWVRLWQYYINHMNTGVWIPYDMGGVVTGELAVVWCHRKTKLEWKGSDKRPSQGHEDREFVSRSTMVFRKEAGDWRVCHVHFSEHSTGERPGGI